MTMKESVRLAAIADLHCPRTPPDRWQAVFSQITQDADVLLLCGDLTDHGRPEEAHLLAQALANAVATMPVIAVLGNHDYEAGQPEEVNQILSAAGVHMLDGEACEIQGIGFAGVKGFGGGFGQASLQPWGENAIKRFVEEAIGEAVKLESALAKLRTPQRIAVLHYAPIRDTVAGEPAGASFCEHVARHSRNRRVSPIGGTHPRFYPSANGREAASVPAALAPEFLGPDHLLAR